MASVSFYTFCCQKDFDLIHAPKQLYTQVWSNNHPFSSINVINQQVEPKSFEDISPIQYHIRDERHIDEIISNWGVSLTRQQYEGDRAHHWKYHVVNHLFAANNCRSDYIVFADNDCWMVERPNGVSWIDYGMMVLEYNPLIWMVSPNDGEPERMTQRISQQMFMCRTSDFKSADFNQPNWDGNTRIEGGPLPEYWAMLEGRIEIYLKSINKFRYVLPGHYRYWHHNRTENGRFITDRSRY